jgi:hypothetical protein
MAYSWPIDKLTLINSALAMTGNNLCATYDDGSDEFNVCSPAYDRGIGYISESHSWGFATQVAILQPAPSPPTDTAWDTAYPIPTDCVHIIWLKINNFATLGGTVVSNQPAELLYDIMGSIPAQPAQPNQVPPIPAYPFVPGPVIVCNAQGGPPPPNPPVTPAQITLKYVSNAGPLTDSTSGTPTLILALQAFVMSGIYRGLHEDVNEAAKCEVKGNQLLQLARTRYDQQKPKRQFWNSRMYAARGIRRPWPPIGIGNWGGSNTPGLS